MLAEPAGAIAFGQFTLAIAPEAGKSHASRKRFQSDCRIP